MAHKENKGGILTNEQIEQDLKAKGGAVNKNGYRGLQDTGDDKVRSAGNDVQQQDGLAAVDTNPDRGN